MLDGIAKPMPEPPADDRGVDADPPRPARFTSGPPELPGLIAAFGLEEVVEGALARSGGPWR